MSLAGALSYNVIMRTIIDIPEKQLSALNAWCDREKISRAEAIRRALDVVLPEKQAGKRADCFGAWKPRKGNGRLVRTLRGEWES